MPHPMAREELLHHDDPAGIPVECFVEQGVPVFCKGGPDHDLLIIQEDHGRSVRQRLTLGFF